MIVGLIGRNDPCYCDSGKKYKKCCLENDERMMNLGTMPMPNIEAFSTEKTSHDISFGIKQLALALLEQLNTWLSKKHIKPDQIQLNSTDLLELANSENMVEKYLEVNRELIYFTGRPHMELEIKNLRDRANVLPSLTENERTIIRTISKGNLGEFWSLSDNKTADYSAMKVLNEFCYQVIKEGVPDNKFVSSATLYVDANDNNFEKLVNWELGYIEEPTTEVWVTWKPLDQLNDEYRKIAHSMHGLEEQSKNELATALYQEKALPIKSKNRTSYRGLIMTYTGILEKELKILIELNEGREVPGLMLKRINDYLRENEIPYINENIAEPSLYLNLEEIRKIRNEAAHGNDVSFEDFIKIKRFSIDGQFFDYISQSKIYFEDSI